VGDLQAAGIEPHIAQNITAHRGSAVPDAIAATPGYAVSLRVRQRIEQVFGWGKTVGPMRKTQRRGRANDGRANACSASGPTTWCGCASC
jgi:hypothetical protein